MKKIFTGYGESEELLWQRVEDWVTEQKDKSAINYLNKEKVVIIETHEDKT